MDSNKSTKKILVITLSNLGDVVLTLPVFQSLSETFPDASLDVITSPGAAVVFQGHPRIGKITPYNKRIPWKEKAKLLSEIRAEKYDILIDLRKSLFGFFGGARIRNPYFSFIRRPKHRLLRHLEKINRICPGGIPEVSFLDGFEAADISKRLKAGGSGKIIVAAVGSKSDIKKWPAESYAKLLDRLISVNGCRVILVGDKNDTADAKKVKELMKNKVEDVSGATDFHELCAFIRSATLVITNDSAPLHIAQSLSVPTLAIFGPTDPKKYGPILSNSLAVRRTLFCAPCEEAQCRYHHECLTDLGVEEVYQKAVRLLEDRKSSESLRILILRLDRFGDVMLTLPAIAAIRKRFPEARISVMLRPYTRSLLEGHPLIDEVIVYEYQKKGRHTFPRGYARFVQEIIERRFDMAFVLHPSVRAHLLPFLAGIPYRIGFDSNLSFLLTKAVPDQRNQGLKHESEYTLDVIRAFGISENSGELPPFPVFPEQNEKSDALFRASGWRENESMIALHPGASCPSKRWPKERFAETAKKLKEGGSFKFVIVGGGEEKEAGDFLARELGSDALNMAGMLSLKETAALLKRCRLLISNDSGPVHLAAAVGTKTLTIFGRNQAGLSARRWKALGAGHATIQKNVGCVVCLAHRCTIDFECLKAVEVGEVVEKATEILGVVSSEK